MQQNDDAQICTCFKLKLTTDRL